MKGLLHKKLTKKGFTLAELLIVVAILAILVAVSIPIFTTKLADAKKATDEANLRACKALVANAILSDEYPASQWKSLSDGSSHYAIYDAENGCLLPSDTKKNIKGYGQGSATVGETNYSGVPEILADFAMSVTYFTASKDAYIMVTVDAEHGVYFLQWIPTT